MEHHPSLSHRDNFCLIASDTEAPRRARHSNTTPKDVSQDVTTDNVRFANLLTTFRGAIVGGWRKWKAKKSSEHVSENVETRQFSLKYKKKLFIVENRASETKNDRQRWLSKQPSREIPQLGKLFSFRRFEKFVEISKRDVHFAACWNVQQSVRHRRRENKIKISFLLIFFASLVQYNILACCLYAMPGFCCNDKNDDDDVSAKRHTNFLRLEEHKFSSFSCEWEGAAGRQS